MLDFTRLMLISTQVEVVVEVGVELGKKNNERNNNLKIFKIAKLNSNFNYNFILS